MKMETQIVKLSDIVNHSLNVGDNITHADLYITRGHGIESHVRKNDIEYTSIKMIDNSINKLETEAIKQPALHNQISRLKKWKKHISNILSSK